MEPTATNNEKIPIGLTALLPVEKIEGHNILVLTGWETTVGDDAEVKYVLHLADGRKTKAMSANKLLEGIGKFEMEHPDVLFKRKEGGYNYTKQVVVEYDYKKKGGFTSPYSSVVCYLKGQPKPTAQPSPTKTVGAGSGHPTSQQRMEFALGSPKAAAPTTSG